MHSAFASHMQSRRLVTAELSDPEISSEIAAKLSRFHKMVMPFNKKPVWLFKTMEKGFDFGNHFCEWAYNYQHDEWPFYKAELSNYPNRQQQLHFFHSYLMENNPALNEEDRHVQAEAMIIEVNRECFY
ncbi:hypothetical protein AB205_0077880, partial [Aquarana catesbeiana]